MQKTWHGYQVAMDSLEIMANCGGGMGLHLGLPLDSRFAAAPIAGPLSTPGGRSTTDSEGEKRQMPRLEKWSGEIPAAV